MHAKHRNGPGNGYRSNVMGMGGMPSASRVPSEGTMRGHRMYNSNYRSYNRAGGYGSSGGGHSKQFQQSTPPPRGPGIFVEAGKLAAEYLVSKGVLPPIALSGNWQDDSLKNVGNHPGFRSHEVEVHGGGRGPIHSRLGNAGLDMGPGRRRNSDDHGPTGSRISVRERKRTGLFRNYESEANRDLGCSGSWDEKINDVESDAYHASVRRCDEQLADKDGKDGARNTSPGEITQEADGEARVESGLEKSKLVEDTNANDGTPGNRDAADGELVENSDDAIKFNNEAEVVKVGRTDDLHKKCDGLVSEEDHVDLVKHSKFVHVPTRARSSLTVKNSKSDQDPVNNKDESIDGMELPKGPGVHVVGVDVENSATGASSLHTPDFKNRHSDAHTMEPERSNSMLMERGEKRALDFDTDFKDDVKKLRQWVPVLGPQPDGSSSLSDSMENHSLSQDPTTSLNADSTLTPDQKTLDISIFSNDHAGSCEFMEEKQLFPGSFKTCDLNLVGNGDVSDNRHVADHMLGFHSIMQAGQISTPIDVDLSINNNGNSPNKNGKSVMSATEIEVIDLEKDSTPEDKTFSNPPLRRGDTIFTDLDGFSNSAHNGNGIPDVQDGYGLMISELLGHENPNVDLNSMHNHMDLPNAEGILGDDDSIYMSLGEIPISLLGAWEQPSQDYGKPF